VDAVANNQLLAFILVDKLACVLGKDAYPDDMIRSGSHNILVVRSDSHVVDHSSVASETHHMVPISKIKHLNHCDFLPRACC
jgi:hypothetical protein